jgi:cation transporter-like permease
VLLLAGITIASASNSLGRKSALLTVLVPAAIATRGFAGPVARPRQASCANPMLRHAA